MSDFTIKVKYDPKTKKFSYIDEGNNPATVKKHCNKRQTIRWTLTSGGASLAICFPDTKDGNPFNPPVAKLQSDHDYKFNDHHGFSYRYTIIVYDAAGKEIGRDDPQIIFDDGTLDPGTLMVGGALEKIPQAAEQAWEKLFDKLRTAIDSKEGSAIQFYPHGITDIEVSVGFAGVTVTVKVSGPDS